MVLRLIRTARTKSLERRRHDSVEIWCSTTSEVVLLFELLPRFVQRGKNRGADHLLLCSRRLWQLLPYFSYKGPEPEEQTTHLIRMHLRNPLHVINFHLARHQKISHSNLFPPASFPENVLQGG